MNSVKARVAFFIYGPMLLAASVSAENDAVLLHLGNDLQQVRVEAQDAETGRWLAIASGYRDKADPGWLKVALPEGYDASPLRVLGSGERSPFAGNLNPLGVPDEQRVDYPPDALNAWTVYDMEGGGPGADAVIEEADIWAWNESTLFFYNQYRGLQVIDMSEPLDPEWRDYFRYPAKGEDLYSLDNGSVVLIGTGSYWSDSKVALQFLHFNGSTLDLVNTVELPAGDYMDSRRYNDHLYVMTREWVEDINPDGDSRTAPLVRLYTVSLLPGVADRIVDIQTFRGNGWLDAVLTAQPDGILLSLNQWYDNDDDWRYRWRSEVNVLVPGEDGVPELAGVAQLSGIVHDKFKINYNDGILTAISQKADWETGQFSRITELENFTFEDGEFTKTGSLELAPGETLFATRFYGDTVYVVTFLVVDPLFAIDNSNPQEPVIAGDLKVPGYSNYIEWVDDQLFAVGIEDQKLTVSIFDVADPTSMSLKDRVFLNEDSWAYSEAQYDDQAISFFPGQQLLMLPFTTWTWESAEQIQAMQLVSWDETGLQLRGAILHLDTPRRGTLTGDTVVTVSGRQVVTTDISDLDLPVEGGHTTLAWNVQTLIPHDDYLLQLETSATNYHGLWYWDAANGTSANFDPVLYVTSMEEPNIPASEVPLESGRLLGALQVDGKLLLLQDISDNQPVYWEIPEFQSLALRAYDLTDPLDPELLDEALLEEISYLGDAFSGYVLPDGSVVWASDINNLYGYMFMDFWPGGWYFQDTLSYLVNSPVHSGHLDVLSWKSFNLGDQWSNSSRWFWEQPLLLASITRYAEEQDPEGHVDYVTTSHLVAVDFEVPEAPLELPAVQLPSNLVAVESLPDGLNHYLYFEPEWSSAEVWAWDEAVAFKLFSQDFQHEDSASPSAYSAAWIPPFHARQRSQNENGTRTSYLDIWMHDPVANRFARADEIVFEDDWLWNNAVLDPYFIQATRESLYLFEANKDTASFDLLDSAQLEFPNVYNLNLESAVFSPETILIPAGLYGVEAVSLGLPPETSIMRGHLLEQAIGWSLVDPASWTRVDKSAHDEAGILNDLNWLYYPDSIREIDSQAEDGGDFWRNSAWFGWYAHDVLNSNWIHHLEHGLLYAYPVSSPNLEGIYFEDDEIGTFWTRKDIYPWIYAYSGGEWLYYLEGSGQKGRRWFYGLSSGWF